MLRNCLLFGLFFLLLHRLTAQPDDLYVSDYEPIKYEDFIYKKNINTVLLHPEGLLVAPPILDLFGNSRLQLSFDDLTDEVKDYYYHIVHCDADWQPTTELMDMDYLDGFTNQRLLNYEFSYNTLTNYIHYELFFPNEDLTVTKSGNYLLMVYEDEDRENLVLTRRFFVVDNRMKVTHKMMRPTNYQKSRTHQEIDFTVNHRGINVANPQLDLKVVLLQNGRWDNALTGLKPAFVRNEELLYDYQNEILFSGGKEFRYVNLQSLRYKTDKVRVMIEDAVDGNIIQLIPDASRANLPYIFDNDMNGKFVVNNEHDTESEVRADYVWVHFYLQRPIEETDGEVYLFGALTNWRKEERFLMTYRPSEKAYHARVLLKQGFYNYLYAFARHDNPDVLDTNYLEGSSFESENDYLILVYYRPFGSRYDQLVAVRSFKSTQW